ncbi:hypothetical protein QCA50_018533 [Cerrena zonata]|uniref:Cytochrome P450 n=1 Tax=Cerrena zonata TaxID=2478898 RepID=A0AAW0FAV7_9APHY
MLDVPSVMPWKKFQEWSKVYGDVMYLDLPGNATVVLGSAQAAADLLDKRSDIYSDRPTSVMHQLMSWDWNLAFMPYSQTWRDHRREFHQFFNQREVVKYQPIQLRECRAFLRRVLTPSVDLGQHIRQTFTGTILKIAYNMDIADLNDEYVLLAQKAVEGVSVTTVPGVFWVEQFPILKYIPSWVPGTYSKRMAEYYKPIVESMRDKPFDEIKQNMLNGNVTPSMTSSMIERLHSKSEHDRNPINEELARNVSAVAYAGEISLSLHRQIHSEIGPKYAAAADTVSTEYTVY